MSFRLDNLSRVPLAHLPTPLDELKRLRDALGGPEKCPRILVKRDDLTGLAFGGNKIRKLEFLVADALAKGATTLITAGAWQSNHARATVAAGNKYGLSTILVLDTTHPNPPVQGNLLLDHLLGADVRIVPKGTDRYAVMNEAADQVRANGGEAYVIPVGGSSSVGAAGYLTMTVELAQQLRQIDATPTRLYFANGSRGTQAGIVLGAKLLGMTYIPYGILVSPGSAESDARSLVNANEAARLVGSDIQLTPADLISVDGYFGEDYGIPTREADEAILLLARTESVFLDPVYTGKAFSALLDHIRTGEIAHTETVVFVHTGGTVALFANAERLAELAGVK